MQNTKTKNWVLLGIVGLSLLIFLFPPIAQDPSYHDFADARLLAGIPNFMNVLSNFPFAIIGLWGLYFCSFSENVLQWTHKLVFTLLFIGVFLISLGSAYYHYSPSNHTLVWDRLPMTVVFMSFFSFILMNYVGEQIGKLLLLPLLFIGVASVWYWYYSELNGEGDLRLYAWVQFFPALLIPAVLILFPSARSFNRELGWIAIWYALAKVAEHYDTQVYDALHYVSGHTLKHLAAAMSTYYMLVIAKHMGTKPVFSPK